jgi:hypothetical protein
MSIELSTPTVDLLVASAREAGLNAASAVAGADFHGKATARVAFEGAGAEAATPLYVELSEGFVPETDALRAGLTQHLREMAARLATPTPELYVTVSGLPLRLTKFEWPFHRSTSGADTLIVHGLVQLADGSESVLHTKISASMTVTFAEIVEALEQPYAEDFIYNAIRKTFDYGQLELLKSGNRQPVHVTTRYYSRWQKKFLFTDTTEQTRAEYLAMKAFWLSGVYGAGAPVWLADPRDAQYLNVTVEELVKDVDALVKAGMVTAAQGPAAGFAAATPKLLAREAEFRTVLDEAMEAIKPAFNESMRGGHTNM